MFANRKLLVFMALPMQFFCCVAMAQLSLEKVASFPVPQDGPRRISGGRKVQFSQDGEKIIVAFYGSAVQLFDLQKNEQIGKTIRTAGDGEVGFISDEVAYTADWGSMRLWDASSGNKAGIAIHHELREDTIIHPAIGPECKRIATRSTMDSVQLWTREDNRMTSKSFEYPAEISSIRFSDDGGILLVRAGGSLYGIDSKTGEQLTEAIPAGRRFYHFSRQETLITTEHPGDGPNQLVLRSTNEAGWPESHRINLPGNLSKIVALNDDKVLIQTKQDDYTPAFFTLNLRSPLALSEVKSKADRAFRLMVTDDKLHWICSNIKNICCQRVGESEPVWVMRVPPSGFDQKIYPMDNEHFFIRDKQANLAIYQVSDAAKVWSFEGVNGFTFEQNRLAICTAAGVELWAITDR
ncbi:MAG: WD40 repeat domain-containing protein [Planctomycetota bacterium]